MRWCDDHWTRLREAVEAREGFADLIARDGKRAMQNTVQEIEQGKLTLATFDPLMNAFWAINTNASEIIAKGAGTAAALYLLAPPDAPEDPVDPRQFPEADGRTWPRCPLCYLGLAHELTCKDARCSLPKVDGYAWMIDRAADEQVEVLTKLRAEEATA